MAINEELKQYTEALRLVQGLVSAFVPLGGTIIGLINLAVQKAGSSADQTTIDEAQASVKKFTDEVTTTRDQITEWQATHPVEGDNR